MTDQYEGKQQPTYRSFSTICLIAFNISLSSFYFGYTVIYYAAIPPQTINILYKIPFDSALAQGLLNGAVSLGGLAGSCLSSILLHHLSRRNCLLLLDGCSIIAGVLIYIPNFYSFLASRTLQGICVGAFSSISPIVIKEMSPLEVSGLMGNFSQVSLTVGVFFGQFLSYVLKKWTGDQSGEEFWVVVFGFTFLTQALQMVVLLFVFPYETPKYLLLNNQKQQCQQLIRILYKDQYCQQVYQEKIADIAHQQEENSPIATSSHQKVLPLAALVAAMLTSLQQLSGINAMILYASDIAKKSFTGEIVLLIPMLMNIIIFAFTCLAFLVLHKIGRKPIIVTGFAVAAVACAMITCGYWSSQTSPAVVLAGIVLYMMTYGASLGPIGWAYIPQIVPPSAMPYIVACNWLSYGLVAMFFPIVTQKLLGGNPCVLFLFFTCVSIVGAVFNWKYMIQTKDKTQKAIMEQYKAAKCC